MLFLSDEEDVEFLLESRGPGDDLCRVDGVMCDDNFFSLSDNPSHLFWCWLSKISWDGEVSKPFDDVVFEVSSNGLVGKCSSFGWNVVLVSDFFEDFLVEGVSEDEIRT